MIDITAWTASFLSALERRFGERVLFVGLQGSYARGEATETSDIDIVVILDRLSVSDIEIYNTMLDNLPHRESVCGFLSGTSELLNWEPSDLFQFYHDTTPLLGSLDALLPLLDHSAVDRAIKIGACNIYHGCVHNMLHDKSDEILKNLYKSASFVIQAICFRDTGTFIRHQTNLLEHISIEEHTILTNFLNLKNGGAVEFQRMSADLFAWSQRLIQTIGTKEPS